MIKVSFCAANAAHDVCSILEEVLTNQIDIESWLSEKIPAVEFNCMDFPYDSEAFYDCYFTSYNENADAYSVNIGVF